MRLREDRLLRDGGEEGIYAVVEKSPAAVVLPLHEGRVVLVEQHRHTVGERFWEFPQGAYEGEPQPAAEQLARMELAEETGFQAGRWSTSGASTSPTACRTSPSTPGWPPTSAPEPRRLSPRRRACGRESFEPAEVQRMIERGAIADAATVAVWGLAQSVGGEEYP